MLVNAGSLLTSQIFTRVQNSRYQNLELSESFDPTTCVTSEVKISRYQYILVDISFILLFISICIISCMPYQKQRNWRTDAKEAWILVIKIGCIIIGVVTLAYQCIISIIMMISIIITGQMISLYGYCELFLFLTILFISIVA